MTFFSVDVETTSTNCFGGSLLTVGVVPVVNVDGKWQKSDYIFYDRIEGPFIWADESTKNWWMEQDEEVRKEAFGVNVSRYSPRVVAEGLQRYVRAIEPDPSQCFFVANPVAFDKSWIDKLFYTTGVTNPFHYRSLCLRSMKYGQVVASGGDHTYGSDRTTHEPKIPHHALWDAVAQADDLLGMLNK